MHESDEVTESDMIDRQLSRALNTLERLSMGSVAFAKSMGTIWAFDSHRRTNTLGALGKDLLEKFSEFHREFPDGFKTLRKGWGKDYPKLRHFARSSFKEMDKRIIAH